MRSAVIACVGACVSIVPLAPALAQPAWTPGSEIVGQSVQVQTNGITNTVYFDQGGAARIVTPNGTEVPARWSAANQSLCLETAANVQECWPYRSAFQPGQAMSLTSSCQITSSWLANATNQPTPDESLRRGERG